MTDQEAFAYRVREALLGVYPEHYEDGTTAISPTGESYISFCIAGQRAQDAGHVYARSAEDAERYFIQSLLSYARSAPKGSVLYWRMRPEIGESFVNLAEPDFITGSLTMPLYACYARLLISDKPVLETAQEAA